MGTLRKVRPNGHIFGGIALRATAPATEDKFRIKDKTKRSHHTDDSLYYIIYTLPGELDLHAVGVVLELHAIGV